LARVERTPVPSHPAGTAGIGPRFGLAYSLDQNTVIRASAGRSFGVVKAVTGSTHFEGAIIIFRPSSLDNGVTPAFLLDEGLPPYVRPPVIYPRFSNGNNTDYWDNEAVRLPETYQWTLSVQRQLAEQLRAGNLIQRNRRGPSGRGT
jgi:hypothetical protein